MAHGEPLPNRNVDTQVLSDCTTRRTTEIRLASGIHCEGSAIGIVANNSLPSTAMDGLLNAVIVVRSTPHIKGHHK